MTAEWSSDESPAVRARVPTHVADGQLGTGVIVVTGPTEFVFDFVRNLPRPSVICARVVLPHAVMPQFINALERNLELYRQRYGSLPGQVDAPAAAKRPARADLGGSIDVLSGGGGDAGAAAAGSSPPPILPGPMPGQIPPPPSVGWIGETAPVAQPDGPAASAGSGPPADPVPAEEAPADAASAGLPPAARDDEGVRRHPNPHEVYDELKLRDELLSGAYANAVMIGHGQHEFSFDFITNFYPQSAVSVRVYVASGHVMRMLESMRTAWAQLRDRFEPPAGG